MPLQDLDHSNVTQVSMTHEGNTDLSSETVPLPLSLSAKDYFSLSWSGTGPFFLIFCTAPLSPVTSVTTSPLLLLPPFFCYYPPTPTTLPRRPPANYSRPSYQSLLVFPPGAFLTMVLSAVTMTDFSFSERVDRRYQLHTERQLRELHQQVTFQMPA